MGDCLVLIIVGLAAAFSSRPFSACMIQVWKQNQLFYLLVFVYMLLWAGSSAALIGLAATLFPQSHVLQVGFKLQFYICHCHLGH